VVQAATVANGFLTRTHFFFAECDLLEKGGAGKQVSAPSMRSALLTASG
jgi:hypothetical protein